MRLLMIFETFLCRVCRIFSVYAFRVGILQKAPTSAPKPLQLLVLSILQVLVVVPTFSFSTRRFFTSNLPFPHHPNLRHVVCASHRFTFVIAHVLFAFPSTSINYRLNIIHFYAVAESRRTMCMNVEHEEACPRSPRTLITLPSIDNCAFLLCKFEQLVYVFATNMRWLSRIITWGCRNKSTIPLLTVHKLPSETVELFELLKHIQNCVFSNIKKLHLYSHVKTPQIIYHF